MTWTIDRLRSPRRIGLVGIVLLALIVLLVAHSLIMGAGHDDPETCGPCVVVLLSGLAAIVTVRPSRSVPAATLRLSTRAPAPPPWSHPLELRSTRSTVLRL